MPPRPRTMQENLDRYVTRGDPSACWPYMGPRMTTGYGNIQWHSRAPIGAHRASWILANGPIPPGLFVCHKCDNPPCCNPAHLFLGTQKDNLEDMARKGRHYSKTKPERLARGERNGQHTHPERRAKGTRIVAAQLNERAVAEIRERLTRGESGRALARDFNVDKRTIYRVRDRQTWAWL